MFYPKLTELKSLLAASDTTLRAACEQLELDYNAISRMINGYTPPLGTPIEKLRNYCNARREKNHV